MVDAGFRDIVFSSTAPVYSDPVRTLLSPSPDATMALEPVLLRYSGGYDLPSAALPYFADAVTDPDTIENRGR